MLGKLILAKHKGGKRADAIMAAELVMALTLHATRRQFPKDSSTYAVLSMRKDACIRRAWNAKHRLGEFHGMA